MKSSETIENIRKYLAKIKQDREQKKSLISSSEVKLKKLKQLDQELYSVSYQSIAQLIYPKVERERIQRWMDGKEEVPNEYLNQISELATFIQVKILDAVDIIIQKDQPRTYLVDHINDWTLEDYEPKQYKVFKNAELHCSFVIKLRTALKKIDREVYLTRFDYKDYDSWLNITGRKNSPESIELWARKRYDEGINSFGETPEEEEKRTRETISPFVEHIIKERIRKGEISES